MASPSGGYSANLVYLISSLDEAAEDAGEASSSCSSSSNTATKDVSVLHPEVSVEEDPCYENPGKTLFKTLCFCYVFFSVCSVCLSTKGCLDNRRRLTKVQAVGKEIKDILHAMDC